MQQADKYETEANSVKQASMQQAEAKEVTLMNIFCLFSLCHPEAKTEQRATSLHPLGYLRNKKVIHISWVHLVQGETENRKLNLVSCRTHTVSRL
jgi:hypothetical protein